MTKCAKGKKTSLMGIGLHTLKVIATKYVYIYIQIIYIYNICPKVLASACPCKELGHPHEEIIDSSDSSYTNQHPDPSKSLSLSPEVLELSSHSPAGQVYSSIAEMTRRALLQGLFANACIDSRTNSFSHLVQ